MDATREALKDAIELAEEGWGYVDTYFREKWEFAERVAALRSVLSQEPGGAREVVCGNHWHGLSGEPVNGDTGCPWCHIESLRGEIDRLEAPSDSPSPGEAPRPTCHACEIEDVTYGSRPREEHDPSADCRYAPPSSLRLATAMERLADPAADWEQAKADLRTVLTEPVNVAASPSAESDLEELAGEIESALRTFEIALFNQGAWSGSDQPGAPGQERLARERAERRRSDLTAAILSALRRAGGRT